MKKSSNEWFNRPSKTVVIAICVTFILSFSLLIYGASGNSNASLITLLLLFLAPSLAVVVKIFKNYKNRNVRR